MRNLRCVPAAAAALVLACATAARAELPRYRVTGLAESPTVRMTYASSLNNRGEVLGNGYFGADRPSNLVYRNGRLEQVQALSRAWLLDMNDRGDIAGSGFQDGSYPLLYRDGRLINLTASLNGVVGGVANAVNNQGHVVGWHTQDNVNLRKFYYDGHQVHTLSFEYGFIDINDHDVMLNAGGFIYDHGRIEEIPGIGPLYGNARPVALNNSGQVVGYADVQGRYVPFLYSNGVITDLGSLGGFNGDARDINDQGWVVGRSQFDANDWDAFLHADDALHNLEDLLAPRERGRWDFDTAVQVNERGQILVLGAYGRDIGYSVALLSPVPEPRGGLLMLAGLLGALGAVAARRRRRCS
ncbi:HAF repeat-containing PEP-CTERM protein [Azohydromonas caseinilytica]|uniref:PEP-CTERM sorting domain-containing protein n=1 Tax=Azohydromonas caseinilytica TaxID=2728836 RepID=A0A848FGP7_9BURK|nr:HAF repeat-containing PEP-CTERM protein [Azohydromonas caseinilytica]NML18025.1 PEP-CTERM sorting domain-containing protein [Azohydromonas caseinilytica]